MTLKVIRKTITVAAKHGWVVLSFDKSTRLYLVEHNMTRVNMSFHDLSDRAYNFSGQWRV